MHRPGNGSHACLSYHEPTILRLTKRSRCNVRHVRDRKRLSPWLASIVTLVVLIGIFPVAAFSAQDALTYDLTHMGSNPLFMTIAQQFNNDGVMSYYNVMFIVGTVFGPTLIGIALWRARAVPIWAAILITFSRLLVFLYPFVPGLPGIYVQLLSWGLLFIGSIPAALAMLKVPYNES
jgi:hypothetical protein